MALWNGPTVGRGMTSADLITSALDQPMSLGATLWDQAKGGALESFGLGTAIRDLTTPDTLMVAPEGATPGQVFDRQLQRRGMDSIGRAIGQGAALLENRDVALTEEEFKASPNYRIGIPYDAGMTAERQAALAEMYDIKKAREFYASKRPIAAFIGNLAGQATDPINYIPALGPATKAAAVARFGRIGGTALVAGADAALNTAAAFGATAGTRARFGDDVSWDSAVSQIATAALIGGAFGTVAGVMGRRADVRQEALVREAEQRLATLKRTQEGRMALNDAVQSLAIDGEVRLSPASIDVVERTAAELSRPPAPFVPDPQLQTSLDEMSRLFIGREPGAKITLQDVQSHPRYAEVMQASGMGRLFEVAPLHQKELGDLANEISAELGITFKNPGIKGQPRTIEKFAQEYGKYRTAKDLTDVIRGGWVIDQPGQADAAVARLGERFEIKDKGWITTPQGYFDRKVIVTFPDGYKAEVQLWHPELLAAKEKRGGHKLYEEARSLPPNDPRIKPLEEKMIALYEEARSRLSPDWIGVLGKSPNIFLKSASETTAASIPTTAELAAAQAPFRNTNAVPAVQTAGSPSQTAYFMGPTSEETIAASTRVGKAESIKDAASQYGVDPATGDFVEAAELDALRNAGRLTEDEIRMLDEADQAKETGDAFAEALKAAVGCLL